MNYDFSFTNFFKQFFTQLFSVKELLTSKKAEFVRLNDKKKI